MNKSTLTLVVSLFAVLLLVLTNPSDADHKAAVKTKFNVLVQERTKKQTTSEDANFAEGLGTLLGGFFIDKLIDTGVTRSNYLLFSTTSFTFGKESKTIGFGILGNVFFSSKVDEALKEADDISK